MKKYVIGNDYTLYTSYFDNGNIQLVVTKNIGNYPVGETAEVAHDEIENAMNNAECIITFESPQTVVNIGKHLLKFLKEVYPDEFKND